MKSEITIHNVVTGETISTKQGNTKAQEEKKIDILSYIKNLKYLHEKFNN